MRSGPSWQLLKYRRGAGPWDATGNRLGGFQRFGCVRLRLTRKFLEQGDVLRFGQGEQPGCSSLPDTWCHHGMGPCSPGAAQQVLGDQEGLGKVRSFLVYLSIFISRSLDFSGGFSVQGHQQIGAFLARLGFPP